MPDGKSIAYFRGRKLHGRKVKIPGKYVGVLLSSSHQKLYQEVSASENDGLEGEGPPVEVGVMLEQCCFDEFIVWGHEVLPDEKEDPYIRAVEEWISLAEAACFQPKGSSIYTNCIRSTHTLYRTRCLTVRRSSPSLDTCHCIAWRWFTVGSPFKSLNPAPS
jgi:hypothetical protein